MWKTFQTATATRTRPSELYGIDDAYAAIQFDHAVTLVGRTIENALEERYNAGDSKKPDWKPKYELDQILSESFRFPPRPKPPTERERQMAAIEVLRGWAKMTKSVRVIKPQ